MDPGSAKGVTVQQTGPTQGELGGSGFIAQEPRSPGQTSKQPEPGTYGCRTLLFLPHHPAP